MICLLQQLEKEFAADDAELKERDRKEAENAKDDDVSDHAI